MHGVPLAALPLGLHSRNALPTANCPLPTDLMLAIETRGLTRAFGSLIAVDHVDLAVPRGSFYGFLGPNGAGKSTTIRCLTGLLTPSSGTIRILGLDPSHDELAIKRSVGVVPEELALFDRLTAVETLNFVGRVYGVDSVAIDRRAGDLLDLMDLRAAGHMLAGDYSHGMKKKLALAASLLPSPRLLFLDEPFEGIDAVTSRQIKSVLAAFVHKGGTVFLTSHILELVERLCDHVGIITSGRLVAQGSIDALRGRERDSLEHVFLRLVGAPAEGSVQLEWLGKSER